MLDKLEKLWKALFETEPNDNKLEEKSINKIEVKKENATREISETKCTCASCSNVWFYGKKDVQEQNLNRLATISKGLMACSCCLPALLIPDKKIIDLEKCPKCGSKAVKKENVVHYV